MTCDQDPDYLGTNIELGDLDDRVSLSEDAGQLIVKGGDGDDYLQGTKRYGDEDVWDWMFNSGRAEAEYVNIRDFGKQLAYSGYVEAFSETEKQREIMLTNFQVHNFDGVLVYESARVYLAREAKDIDIEFPYVPPVKE